MGTTAQKLTYLNNTKQLLKENINNLGGNLTNEPFRQYASVLEGIYERIPKVSGIGASLSLSPTMVGKIKLNEIQGNTLQDGTPTPDSPVEIQNVTGLQKVNVCGKNLLNLGTKSFTTYYQESNIYIPAGTYTMSAKITSEDTQYPESRAYFYNGNTQVAMFTLNRNTRTSATKTLSNSADRIIIYSSIDYSSSNGKNATWEDIQLEKGSTATSYEPYKGNTYEVNLGKNLFNSFIATKPSWQSGNLVINEDGSFTVSENSGSNNYFQTGQKLRDFCPSLNVGDTVYLYLETTNSNKKIYIGQNWVNGESKTLTETMLNSNFIIYGGYGQTDTIKIMITKGLDTNYSPYFTPIELNKIGTYKDRIYKDNGKWYVEKNTRRLELAIADMDNNENYPGWNNQTQLRQDFPNKNGLLKFFTKFMFNIGSENFEGVSVNTTGTGTLFLGKTYWGSDYTQTYWKENYPNLVFTMVYGIQTPEYTEITNTELIEDLETLYTAKSQEGTTNISITSENLEMILNVSALKGDA